MGTRAASRRKGTADPRYWNCECCSSSPVSERSSAIASSRTSQCADARERQRRKSFSSWTKLSGRSMVGGRLDGGGNRHRPPPESFFQLEASIGQTAIAHARTFWQRIRARATYRKIPGRYFDLPADHFLISRFTAETRPPARESCWRHDASHFGAPRRFSDRRDIHQRLCSAKSESLRVPGAPINGMSEKGCRGSRKVTTAPPHGRFDA